MHFTDHSANSQKYHIAPADYDLAVFTVDYS